MARKSKMAAEAKAKATKQEKPKAAEKPTKAKASKDDDVVIRKVMRMISVPIDAKKVAVKGKRLADVNLEIDRVLAEKKEACSSANLRLKDLRKEGRELSESINTSEEKQEAACKEILNFRTNTVVVENPHTGGIEDERAINAEDRQAHFGFDEKLPDGVEQALG